MNFIIFRYILLFVFSGISFKLSEAGKCTGVGAANNFDFQEPAFTASGKCIGEIAGSIGVFTPADNYPVLVVLSVRNVHLEFICS